ncbi:hypothetical protein AB0I81_55970 [Nonomuraea sp. NPDC050404]|uniref:hypothetical protein n=1 Tax=Nonomuraea sp. NPDC050404 TaxID=3155783 RepID=UPI0033D8AE20
MPTGARSSRLPISVIAALALGFAVVTSTASPAWAVAPANDNFANAQAHTGPFSDTVSNVDATVEGSEPAASCSGVSPYKTVWCSLTLSTAATVHADAFGSNFGTVLTVHTCASLGTLTEVACNDDFAGILAPSELTFSASASTTYWIRVDGFSDGRPPPANLPDGTAVLAVQTVPTCSLCQMLAPPT